MNRRTNEQGREVRTVQVPEFRVLKAENGEAARLTGHAAVFNQVASGGWFNEKIAPGAFADSLKSDDVRALWNHNPDMVLGRNKAGTLKLYEDEKGLVSEITPPDTQFARDLLVSIERGDITQMSFAFQTITEAWEKGDEGQPDLRTLVKVKLYDVSPVTYPFYDGTDVAVRSHDQWRSVSEPVPWRRELLRRRIKIFDMAAGNK